MPLAVEKIPRRLGQEVADDAVELVVFEPGGTDGWRPADQARASPCFRREERALPGLVGVEPRQRFRVDVGEGFWRGEVGEDYAAVALDGGDDGGEVGEVDAGEGHDGLCCLDQYAGQSGSNSLDVLEAVGEYMVILGEFVSYFGF